MTEPLYCSQGGIPYNKAHLDAKDAAIKRLQEIEGLLREHVDHLLEECLRLRDENGNMLEALKAVVAVADRKTVEFDKAHAAIAKAERRS